MSDETKTSTETVTPPADGEKKPAATDNMLKLLGYYTEPDEQEKLPDEGAGDDTKKEDAADTTKTDEGAPKDETKEGETKVEDKPASIPADKRAKVVKAGDSLEKPVTKEDIASAVQEALTKKVDTAPDPLAKYGELSPQEKRALELAQFAARNQPDKYKDMEAREVAWIAKHREYIQKVVDDRGEFTPEDANSDEYRDLRRRHQPTYQPGDKEDLLIARGVEKGLTQSEERFQKELAKRDRTMIEMEVRPQISKTLGIIEDDILSVLDKDVAAAIKANPTKAIEGNGLEAPLAVAIIADTQMSVREYLSLAKGISDYNKDNPVHVKLVDFIRTQGKHLENIPEQQRQREGKVLVSRERWSTIPKEQRTGFTTFTDGDVIDMLAVGGRNYLVATIKTQSERLKAAGFERKAPAAAVTKTEAPPVVTKTGAPAEEKKTATTTAAVVVPPKATTTQPPKGGATAAPGSGGASKGTAKEPKHPALVALGYDKV